MWVSVALVKFHRFGFNWHVFNQSECRNCCLYVVIQKIAPQAKSGKYFQIWFFPRFGGKKWRRSEHVHASYPLDSSFARSGWAPIWGGKKGEFRDWTTWHGTILLFLEQLAPSPVAYARTRHEDFMSMSRGGIWRPKFPKCLMLLAHNSIYLLEFYFSIFLVSSSSLCEVRQCWIL